MGASFGGLVGGLSVVGGGLGGVVNRAWRFLLVLFGNLGWLCWFFHRPT